MLADSSSTARTQNPHVDIPVHFLTATAQLAFAINTSPPPPPFRRFFLSLNMAVYPLVTQKSAPNCFRFM